MIDELKRILLVSDEDYMKHSRKNADLYSEFLEKSKNLYDYTGIMPH
jgi:hypothetical protein